MVMMATSWMPVPRKLGMSAVAAHRFRDLASDLWCPMKLAWWTEWGTEIQWLQSLRMQRGCVNSAVWMFLPFWPSVRCMYYLMTIYDNHLTKKSHNYPALSSLNSAEPLKCRHVEESPELSRCASALLVAWAPEFEQRAAQRFGGDELLG